eukprot:Gb_01021 [translate_table: standard]
MDGSSYVLTVSATCSTGEFSSSSFSITPLLPPKSAICHSVSKCPSIPKIRLQGDFDHPTKFNTENVVSDPVSQSPNKNLHAKN